jgi:hypothetical protein
MLTGQPVPVPTSRKSIKRSPKGVRYVYHILRSYRNENGKPRYDSVIIGKIDDETGLMIPNSKYTQYYPCRENLSDESSSELSSENLENDTNAIESENYITSFSSLNYGATFALAHISDEIGLKKILSDVFPKRWEELLTIAFYIACESNVIYYIDEFIEGTNIDFNIDITSRKCSNIFAEISFAERMSFFKKWILNCAENDYVAYDVTSISSYSKNIGFVEWGHRRNDEKLPQINYGMYYGQKCKLPIFYYIYQGSINDNANLKFMVDMSKSLGLDKIIYVIDRGFCFSESIQYLKQNEFKFIIPLSESRIEAKKLLEEFREDVLKPCNKMQNYKLFGITVKHKFYGVETFAHIFFSFEKAEHDLEIFTETINQIETELQLGLKRKSFNPFKRRYTEYFDICIDEKKNLHLQKKFHQDAKKI